MSFAQALAAVGREVSATIHLSRWPAHFHRLDTSFQSSVIRGVKLCFLFFTLTTGPKNSYRAEASLTPRNQPRADSVPVLTRRLEMGLNASPQLLLGPPRIQAREQADRLVPVSAKGFDFRPVESAGDGARTAPIDRDRSIEGRNSQIPCSCRRCPTLLRSGGPENRSARVMQERDRFVPGARPSIY